MVPQPLQLLFNHCHVQHHLLSIEGGRREREREEGEGGGRGRREREGGGRGREEGEGGRKSPAIQVLSAGERATYTYLQ